MSITIAPAVRLVCPNCLHDENLYSCEKAEIMYPIRVAEGGEIEYTGDDRIVLDEGTVSEDRLYCRSCSTDLTAATLAPVPEADL